MSRHPWDEDTRPHGLLRPSLQQRAESERPPQEDDDSTLGMLMRQTVANTQAIDTTRKAVTALSTDFDVLAREVRQAQRGTGDLVQGSAKHASNRLAVLMGGLFTVYEVSSPYVREIWRQWVHR